ncbi:MAG: GAF domain-containing protein [Actinomycetaceae bacterium]|nr:GAF domain-containing protein [Actinomycetaceae bacterium]
MNSNPKEAGSDQLLIQAALDMTKQLDLREVLQQFVDQACALTGAAYGALAVLDAWGETTMFIHHGFGPGEAEVIGHPPVGKGMIGAIPNTDALIINDIANHPLYTGFPAGHRHMGNFLGVPVQMQGRTFGRLYLADKPRGFGQEDVKLLKILGNVAGVAVENARIYRESTNRERWVTASQTITSAMLEGAEEEEALTLIAETVREVSGADTALIVLPSVGYTWACEIADGHMANELVGMVFPPQGRTMSVLHEGAGMIVDSLARASTLRLPLLKNFGPALYAPLMNRGAAQGVLILLRLPGKMEFESSDLPLAESLASQAAFALELASARHAEDMAALLDERDRISRDLHDFAIQQLFATGMQLDAAREKVRAGTLSAVETEGLLDSALAAVDESVCQIRSIVHDLREPDQDVGVVERIRRETSLARNALGFAPSLIVELDGEAISSADDDALDEVCERIRPDIADDIVAVIREGLANVARHAHATAVRITTSVEGLAPEGQITINVVDDGVGIPAQRGRTSGLGNLRTRARQHGGSFKIEPNPDRPGTRLHWSVPMSNPRQ